MCRKEVYVSRWRKVSDVMFVLRLSLGMTGLDGFRNGCIRVLEMHTGSRLRWFVATRKEAKRKIQEEVHGCNEGDMVCMRRIHRVRSTMRPLHCKYCVQNLTVKVESVELL